MPIKKKRIKHIGKYIVNNRPLTSITFEFGDSGVHAQEGEDEPACPCEGDATLIVEGEGPPACEWGSTECPTNTVEPEDDEPACPCESGPFLNSLKTSSTIRVQLTDSRNRLAERLLGDLLDD